MRKKASKDTKNRKSRNEVKVSSLGLKGWFCGLWCVFVCLGYFWFGFFFLWIFACLFVFF